MMLGSVLISICCSIFAHGSMEVPISRIYQCFKENPENPKSSACKAAVELGGKQPIYNWNEVNQPAANDRHTDIIPDGQLCSGGREFYKGLNLARSDWSTSIIEPDAEGLFHFIYYPTAPHKTKYFKFYITKSDYEFNQPLKWSDLEPQPFCTINTVSLVNDRYNMPCKIPANKIGRQLIFVIWQREDSPEAFYSCSDVFVNNTGKPVEWHELQSLYNTAEIAVGMIVKLRLFHHDNGEIETHRIVVTAENNGGNQWPFALAEEVNANSSLLRIGQLKAETGEVVLIPEEEANKIFINKDPSQYHVAIDFIEQQSQVDFIYPDGIAEYKANTIVMGRHDHKRYQCKPWPYSGWCSQSPTYYEPGVGLAWQEAWILLD
ncbi:GlcNAc-binding protein A precursor [Legionella clemsonensis]|uniref:GlcNAc-binding protein A n=2 Tax=Legionella clemsonensis TaxID=1867846 RepID=A0A222P246_9GAMM|nr:GlcNAc-binding protein A precursor [Legionella clemsonensis]